MKPFLSVLTPAKSRFNTSVYGCLPIANITVSNASGLPTEFPYLSTNVHNNYPFSSFLILSKLWLYKNLTPFPSISFPILLLNSSSKPLNNLDLTNTVVSNPIPFKNPPHSKAI